MIAVPRTTVSLDTFRRTIGAWTTTAGAVVHEYLLPIAQRVLITLPSRCIGVVGRTEPGVFEGAGLSRDESLPVGSCKESGANDGTRTRDPRNHNPVL